MDIKKYKNQIEQYINKNQLDQALKRLLEIIANDEVRNEVITYGSRLTEIKQQKNLNSINTEEYQLEKNRLRNAILDLKDHRLEGNLDPEIERLEDILERLVVYSSSSRQSFFARLLNTEIFKHVSYLDYQEKYEPYTDVIIFEYQQEQEARLQQLLLSEGPPVLILVYQQLNWLFEPQYRDRYATANSIYSLGARLNELITVQKWMNK
jgi:hypothetical protein